MVADGHSDLREAREFIGLFRSGTIQPSEWIGVNTGIMPFFLWLIALHIAAFGDHAPFAYVTTQGLVDSAVLCVPTGAASVAMRDWWRRRQLTATA